MTKSMDLSNHKVKLVIFFYIRVQPEITLNDERASLVSSGGLSLQQRPVWVDGGMTGCGVMDGAGRGWAGHWVDVGHVGGGGDERG